MKIKIFIPLLCVFFILAVSCNKNPAPPVHQSFTLPENADQIIGAQNQFAFQLFKEVLKRDNSNANKLISPLSVYMALGMTYNGAAGKTRDAMQKALQLKNISTDLLNETHQQLIEGLPGEDSKVDINIANSIWYRNDKYQPLAAFLHITKNSYQAQIKNVDFRDNETLKQINNWVASATRQKIKKIIDKIDSTDLMFLINAIYFNGQWKYKFDKSETEAKTFHTITGDVQTPFMTQKGTFRYGRNSVLQIIELPYGSGDFNMYILLPDESVSLKQLTSSLNVKVFNDYLSTLDSTALRLDIPKWKYRYTIKNMKPELADLGMRIAFSRQADFSDMYPREARAYISRVIHKTYIEVDEKGTEAAAVTLVGMAYATSALPPQPLTVKVNRPFLYLITEKSSGSILFLGEVNNPK